MQLTDIRIKLCENQNSRLKAFCALTFDNTFVIRDVKLIDGNDGLFLAMPSRKLCDHCPACKEKNHLRARYCNNCGRRLNETRYLQYRNGNGNCNGNSHAHGNGHGRSPAVSRQRMNSSRPGRDPARTTAVYVKLRATRRRGGPGLFARSFAQAVPHGKSG